MNRIVQRINEVVPTFAALPVVGVEEKLYVVLEDETNSNLPCLYIYENGAYVRTSGGGSGGGGVAGMSSQVTKMNVTASAGAPVTVVLEIPETLDFKRITPEVLKFVAGGTGVVTTLINFDLADAASFEANPFITFDGTLRLKTQYQYPMTEDVSWTGTGKLYTATLNKSQFKTIEKIEVI